MKMKCALFAAALCVLCVSQASALEYSVDAPEDYLFGRPTSQEVVYEQEEVNVDRSKDVALAAPGFGTPTSYLPGTGECLTPNLVPGALSGGLVNATTSAEYTDVPTVSGQGGGAPEGDFSWSINGSDWTGGTAFTEVIPDLYYSGGHLGTLKIPAIGLSVKVYQGTNSAALAKGAGHFEETSIWRGNVCIAGHNRGDNCCFEDIHTLERGDTITLTTKLGTRSYSVTSVEKIRETDSSMLSATSEDCVTLFTCVRNQSAYRWCVRAVAES